MKVPVLALALLGAPVTAAVLAAQAQPRVDFRRDVQPIFREHCYACHGPEQQMNGLRLDRRADAMRGGSQSDIGPGNADGSRLYHRLIGTRFGQQMPPTGPLGAAQVAVIKSWIDQGAEWPDDLAGGTPAPPIDPGAERLTELVRDGDRTRIEEMLRSNPRVARTRAAGGSTVLMFAAEYGDAGLMKRLIDAGAEPGAANTAGATALMRAVPDTDKMRLLLGAGVDPDARSEDRRTALLIASGIVGSAPAVRLLLEYGASPWVPTPSDLSPLREAARVDNADVFRLLLDYGADPNTSGTPVDLLRTNCFRCAEALGVGGAGPLARVPPPDRGLRPELPESAGARARPAGVTAVNPMAIRAAVNRSLPLLQAVDLPFVQKTGCVSCHHNSLVAMAVTAARRNGYQVDEKAARDQREVIARYLESWRERTLQNIPIAGAGDTISYLLFGLGAAQHPSDRATEAQARWLKRRQSSDGRWPVATIRPPLESNDIEVTAISLRALQVYAPKTERAEYMKAVARARDWLAAARGESTEERAFRVQGLSWAGASRDLVTGAARELLAAQRSDGGWPQLSTMDSDAYATGQALVALNESGAVPAADPAFRRGVEFLLRTQLEDGSWLVKSRSVPIQAYFESGFPHGADQWISAAATAWAVTALASAR